jgi:lipid-binding SYLF domain-containing protein
MIMNTVNLISLKVVRWTGWLLLPLVLAFLFSGYAISGRYGLGVLLDEQAALTLHRMLHVPLIVLTVAHSVPAMYLALQRWGWIGPRA